VRNPEPSESRSGRGRTRQILGRASWPEIRYVADALRTETVGGALLLIAATVAMVWANSPWSSDYSHFENITFGPSALHLHLTLSEWAADGGLALFFFVAGMELKREFTVGELRDPVKAMVPVVAAACGVILPAVVFVVAAAWKANGDTTELFRGWAVPTATDIAFALAVLAVLGSHLPSALRSFLLTLAVVDDLIAIVIIAVFYTTHLEPGFAVLALVPGAGFWFALRKPTWRWSLIPLGILAWALVHASGIHSTVAGLSLGLLVPCAPPPGGGHSLQERYEHLLRPISAGIAVPLFALLSAGVDVGGLHGLRQGLGDPAAVGIIAGLVIGKPIGVFGGTYLLARFTRAELDPELEWLDIFGLSLLAGIGFTVSLLVTELAYPGDHHRADHARVAVLIGSILAALLATIVLRMRNLRYRRLWEEEERLSEAADGSEGVGG
jgi:NhaA family Na+:H+ antiporter